jgi:hypothetical protein
MLCPLCYGKHIVLINGARVPCPECAGLGELHCCDGLREQEECPRPADRSTFPPPNPAHKPDEAKSRV